MQRADSSRSLQGRIRETATNKPQCKKHSSENPHRSMIMLRCLLASYCWTWYSITLITHSKVCFVGGRYVTPQKHTKAKHSNAPSKMIVYFVILLGSHGLADFSTLCRLAESSMDKRHRGIPAGNYARNVYILGRGIVISHCVCILIYIYIYIYISRY